MQFTSKMQYIPWSLDLCLPIPLIFFIYLFLFLFFFLSHIVYSTFEILKILVYINYDYNNKLY